MHELALLPIGVIVLCYEDTEWFGMAVNLLHSLFENKATEGQGRAVYIQQCGNTNLIAELYSYAYVCCTTLKTCISV